MFTVIDENMPNAQADLEQDANQNLNLPDFFKTRGNNNGFRYHHHHRHGKFNKQNKCFVPF